METPMGKAVLQVITFKDNKLEFKAEADSPMGKMILTAKGNVEDHKISGDFETPIGPTPFTG